MKGLLQGLYALSEWIMRLAILNILWAFFSLIGGVVLGLFPATISMFEVEKKWLKGEFNLPIFRYFWLTYKKNFLRGNFLGLLLVLVGVIFFIDFNYFSGHHSFIFRIFTGVIMVLFIFYALLFLYVFPIYVLHEISILQCIKYASLLGFYRPLSTIGILLGNILLYLLYSTFPPVLFFFGASLTSFMVMWVSWNTIINLKNISENKISIDKAV